MKYIAYCRKSTDEKDKQVLSIDQQIAELKEFAQKVGIQISEFIIEAKTAKIPINSSKHQIFMITHSPRII